MLHYTPLPNVHYPAHITYIPLSALISRMILHVGVSFMCCVCSLRSTHVLTHPSFTHTQVLDFLIILVSIANLVLTGKI